MILKRGSIPYKTIAKMGEGEAVCDRMPPRMQNAEIFTQEQIQEFLKGRRIDRVTSQERGEWYRFAQGVLVTQEYAGQGRKERGAIRAYLSKVTGLTFAANDAAASTATKPWRTGGAVFGPSTQGRAWRC